jgi:uncharacterized protein
MEERLEFTSDGTRLVGALTRPAAPAPAALLLNGSGPLDRDSNMRGQRLDVAKALAGALAAAGVASLRFDKRGVGESGGDYLNTGFHQETDDALAALAALRDAPGVDRERVCLIGHSVGAVIAARAASADGGIAGAALLCVAAQPGREVMSYQSEAIARTLAGKWRRSWFLRRQERTRRRLVASTGDSMRIMGVRTPAKWLREYMDYSPVADLRAIRCPVLAITGRSDLQVDSDDVERIGALVAGPFTGETPDELTHVLRRDSEPTSLARYRHLIKRPVDPDLLARVASWTSEHACPSGRSPV